MVAQRPARRMTRRRVGGTLVALAAALTVALVAVDGARFPRTPGPTVAALMLLGLRVFILGPEDIAE
jgi:hypothetical protein